MTKIAMRFVTTTDIPIGNALVAIRLTRSDYEEKTSGVLMPRLEEFHTDADGFLQVDLMPATHLYHVTVYDTVQDIAIHHDFIVPSVEDLNTILMLPDLIVPPDTVLSSVPYDEAALNVIVQAKAEALAAAARAKVAADRAEESIDITTENAAIAEAAKIVIQAAEVAVAQDAAEVRSNTVLVTNYTSDALQHKIDAEAAAVSSNAAKQVAVDQAAIAVQAADAAKISEDLAAESIVISQAAVVTTTTARDQAVTARNVAEAAKTSADTSALTAISAKDAAVAAKDTAVAAKDTASQKASDAASSAANAAASANSLQQELSGLPTGLGITGILTQSVTEWADVPRISTTNTLLDGPGGPMNAQAQALVNRTEYLSGSIDAMKLAAARAFGKNVFDFMTDAQILDVVSNTKSLDVSDPVQAWVDYCEDNGRTGYAPSGGYKITRTILKAQSFTVPFLFGDGSSRTMFYHTNPANTACFKFKGGSGSEADSFISGFGFVGTTSNYAVEIADQCGFYPKNCRFYKQLAGVVLHNENGFTEYCTPMDCIFDSDCSISLLYIRSLGGADSFHGSCIKNAHINESATETNSKIVIGGPLSESNDILPYNAELSLQCWKRTGTALIQNFSTRSAVNFHGHITCENFSSLPYEVVKQEGSYLINFVGTFSELTATASLGGMRLVESLSFLTDGTAFLHQKPYKVKARALSAGANNIGQLYAVGGESYFCRLHFAHTSREWERGFLCLVHLSPSIKSVTVVSDFLNYFGGQYGDPTFSINEAGMLIATNPTWDSSGLVCDMSVTQIGFASRDPLTSA